MNVNKYKGFIHKLALKEISRVKEDNCTLNYTLALLQNKVCEHTMFEVNKVYKDNLKYINELENVVSTKDLFKANNKTIRKLLTASKLIINEELSTLDSAIKRIPNTESYCKYKLQEIRKETVEMLEGVNIFLKELRDGPLDDFDLKGKHILILQGGSGSGKSSLTKWLVSLGVARVITCTTRKPKSQEQDGIDYHFFNSKEELLRHDLIECAPYSGNWYGTRKQDLAEALSKSNVICTVMEEQGARYLKENYTDHVTVISLPIDEETMKANMIKRNDTNEFIEERLHNAKELHEDKEISCADLVVTGNDLESKKEIIYNSIRAYIK